MSLALETPSPNRKIIHIDMDAFFASVEQRDDPRYRGKPVIVGGSPDGRGVVAAASYEARVFGVRSAMSSVKAKQLCPEAIFISPRIAVYRRVSRMIMGILREFSDLLEPLSLDEAFLDVSRNKPALRYASAVAKEMKRRVKQDTGLTASAGVAPNKFLAKIASDMQKPDGLTVIQPEHIDDTLNRLTIRAVPGIGRVTEEKMLRLGIHTLRDLRRWSEEELTSHFGKTGGWYYKIARGIDDRPVQPLRERKSIGAETTFAKDLIDLEEITAKLKDLTERIARSIEKRSLSARCVTLKATYADFQKITRSRTVAFEVTSIESISKILLSLLPETEIGIRPIRLIGLSLSHLSERGKSERGKLDSDEEVSQREQLVLPL